MRKYDVGPFQNESESSSCIFLIIIHKLRVRCPFFYLRWGISIAGETSAQHHLAYLKFTNLFVTSKKWGRWIV